MKYKKGLYICVRIWLNDNKNYNIMKRETIKILGQTVTVGTKLHQKLVQQVKLFNDLSSYETK